MTVLERAGETARNLLEELTSKAQAGLQANLFTQKEGAQVDHTAPCGRRLLAGEARPRFLYPFLWLWDNFFISGWRHDFTQAVQDVRTFFSGQRRDGFLGHILYDRGALAGYFPGPGIYYPEGLPEEGPITSKITQPPNVAYGVWELAQKLPLEQRIAFLQEVYPKVFAYHQYIYEKLVREGRLVDIHPWQPGDDDSTKWDDPYANFTNHPEVRAAIEACRGHEAEFDQDLSPDDGAIRYFVTGWLKSLGMAYERLDLKLVDASQRPIKPHYDKYLFLMYLYQKWGWDEEKILAESPFRVQDPMSNAILLRSNQALLEIAQLLGREEDVATITGWQRQTEAGLEELWDEEDGLYYALDLVDGRPIKARTTSSLIPLFYPGLPQARAERLAANIQRLMDENLDMHMIPSAFPSEPTFEPQRYWRGPVWPIINTVIIQGLVDHGFYDLAARLIHQTLNLIIQDNEGLGFHEYHNSLTGEGLGSAGQSWTYAGVIHLVDLIKTNPKLAEAFLKYFSQYPSQLS
jgi:alpha,alpha-trehalase